MVIWDDDGSTPQVWRLIPVEAESTPILSSSLPGNLDSGSLPSYDGDMSGKSATRTQSVEFERDDFGTIVNEVTVVTTNTITNTKNTVTTHKRYRVADT